MGWNIGKAITNVAKNPGSLIDPIGSVTSGIANSFGLPSPSIGGFANNLLGGNSGGSTIASLPRPEAYQPNSLLNDQLQLPTEFQLNPNTDAIDQLRQVTLGNQISPWASNNLTEMNSLKDRLSQQINTQNSSNAQAAMNSMAAGQGLNATSSALIQDQSRNQSMVDQQRLRREQMQGEASINTQEAQIKQSLLEGLPQAELAQSGVEQQNLLNTLGEKRRMDELDKLRYQTEMGNFASEQQAKAIENSGSGGLLSSLFG